MSRVFSIPDGVSFLPALADALMDGRLIEGLSRDSDPLEIAGATIYVPTQRAARELGRLLREALGGAALLPRIAPLGALEPPVEALPPDAVDGKPGEALRDNPLLRPAIAPLRRRLLLMRLVLAWARALKGAIVSTDESGAPVEDGGEMPLVAATPGAAWSLAGQLADLIDELTIEGIPWSRLDDLGDGDHDRYWGITLAFLKIARDHWPAELERLGLMEAAARRAALIEREAQRLARAGARKPVIAAGSTGTSKATQALLKAIAGAPRGAVVLPGLDIHLDDTAWGLIGLEDDTGLATVAGHPQASLHRLLPVLGVTRADVRELGQRDSARASRSRFLSEAMRPADTTHLWSAAEPDLRGLDDVTLIEADDAREEALAIAAIFRDTLETPGRTAILVTPDRGLARRVRAEMLRWDVKVEDTGGESLALRPSGMFAMRVLEAFEQGFRPVALAPLVAHPHLNLGVPRAEAVRLRRKIELGLLRGGPRHDLLHDPAAAIALMRAGDEDKHMHPARRALRESDWDAIASAMEFLRAAFAPLRALAGARPLGEWLIAHRDALAALSDREQGDDPLGAATLESLMQELVACTPESLDMTCADYAGFIGRVLRENAAPSGEGEHPRLRILGLLEARLLTADRVVLGGLDETAWPPQASADAFLNRPMRARLGLTPPERRIGQTAHDFVSAMGGRDIFITRAKRRQREPTVPSRFLLRIAALAGESWDEMLARGARWKQIARALDEAPPASAAARAQLVPAPVPALDLRPSSLSVTAIPRLRDNPYGVYAERILRLKPLEAVEEEPGPADLGNVLHATVAEFAERRGTRAELETIARKHAAPLMQDDTFEAIQWPRISRTLDAYHAWEMQRGAGIAHVALETKGRAPVTLSDQAFTLTARADRIEQAAGGSIALVDFKTGTVPKKKEVQDGTQPQLTLEAAILRHGGFEDMQGSTQADATGVYVKLGGSAGLEETVVDLDDLVDAHWEMTLRLLEHYRDPATPYLVLPRGGTLAHDDYEHLARIREWSATGGVSDNGESEA